MKGLKQTNDLLIKKKCFPYTIKVLRDIKKSFLAILRIGSVKKT